MMGDVPIDPEAPAASKPFRVTHTKKERIERRITFADYAARSEPNADGMPAVGDMDEIKGTWYDRMLWTRKESRHGDVSFSPASKVATVIAILVHDPRWAGVIAYNEFSEAVELRRDAPWHSSDAAGAVGTEWGESTTTRLESWLQRAYGISLPSSKLVEAVMVAAERCRYHPVRDYLRGLRWDAKQRLPDVAALFGVDVSPYTREVFKRWFISAVARVMDPGCQADCAIILEGRTGWRKTSAFRALVPVREWYADSGITIGSKDSYQTIHGVWIYGFDELDSLAKSDLTATKNFITQTFDRYRPSYGRVARNFRRQNVFCGSTNKDDYLNDPTGDRRYWPGLVRRPIDVEALAEVRDQLWAEAVARYDSSEVWHVDTPELRKLCEVEQTSRRAEDPWTSIVERWLEKPIERDDGGLERKFDIADGVTTTDVLIHAIRMRPSDMTDRESSHAGKVLRVLGYTKVDRPRVEDGLPRPRRYRKPTEEELVEDTEGAPSVPPPHSV